MVYFHSSPIYIPGAPEHQIERSLRFNAATDLTYLTKTYGVNGGQVLTISCWFRRGILGAAQAIYHVQHTVNGPTAYMTFGFNASDQLILTSGSYTIAVNKVSTRVFRDPSAWLHLTLTLNTGNANADERARFYVEDTELTSFSPNTNPSAGNHPFGQTDGINQIGRVTAGNSYLGGCLAEFYYIDNAELDPTNFGRRNATTGQWVPKKYGGSYTGNSFYLNFADNSNTTSGTLGKDSSGNANDWTPNNFSVTAGNGNDSLVETPTSYGVDTGLGGEVRGTYANLNPLDVNGNLFLRNANLDFGTADNASTYITTATMVLPKTGRWIWEVRFNAGNYLLGTGIVDHTKPLTTAAAPAYSATFGTYPGAPFAGVNAKVPTSGAWAVTNQSNGTHLVIAYDADTGMLWYGIVASGGTTVTWYNTSGTADPATGADPRHSGISTAIDWVPHFATYFNPSSFSVNFGQRPFSFTNVPSGYKTLCAPNLPSVTVGLPASFVGNANADGPYLWANGEVLSLTINGNVATEGTHYRKTAGGVKLITASVSYNSTGTNTVTAATYGTPYKYGRAL